MRGTSLFGTSLAGAQLEGAALTGAKLVGANLLGANCKNADFSAADLSMANLTGANFSAASLATAKLSAANLNLTKLEGTDLARSLLFATTFSAVDLSGALGLDSVLHQGPSDIAVSTILVSLESCGGALTHTLKEFLQAAGVPPELLAAMPAIASELEYSSCFISYGEPDLDFAETLNQDLRARGVRTWIYSMDATPGARSWKEISVKRRDADKMVVICSAPSLLRDGVLKEIEEQIDEQQDNMIPISRDSVWTHANFPVRRGSRDLKPFLIERNYADFAKLGYDEAFHRLLRGSARHPLA
jgi:hypothetical protein